MNTFVFAPMTLKQVCERTKLSKSRIRQLIKEGKFPLPIDWEAAGIPRLPRGANAWRHEDIEAFIAAREVRNLAKGGTASLLEIEVANRLILSSPNAKELLEAGASTMVRRRRDKGRLSSKKLPFYKCESEAFLVSCVAAQFKANKLGVPVAFEFRHGTRNATSATCRAQITDAYSRVGALITVKRGVEKAGFTHFVQSAAIDLVSNLLNVLCIPPTYYAEEQERKPFMVE
jgi:predicted DNA-binding transcriptional regulator AlpA